MALDYRVCLSGSHVAFKGLSALHKLRAKFKTLEKMRGIHFFSCLAFNEFFRKPGPKR